MASDRCFTSGFEKKAEQTHLLVEIPHDGRPHDLYELLVEISISHPGTPRNGLAGFEVCQHPNLLRGSLLFNFKIMHEQIGSIGTARI
jgi:hypothetical protein